MFYLLLITSQGCKPVYDYRETNKYARKGTIFFFSSSNNSKFRMFKMRPKTHFCYQKFTKYAELCIILYTNG